MITHEYKGFRLVRNGTSAYPWNIYRISEHGYGNWVGYGNTLKSCKRDIDDGCFEEENL